MDLIARIYTEYQDYVRSINHHRPSEGLTNDKIEFSMMLQIPKHVNNKEYAELDKILGAALPEIDEKRYYKLREIKKKDELNFKDLRNIITWQLWITHFRDFFPNFRKELLDTLGNSQPYVKIKQFIFDRTKEYAELSSNDLGIYINKNKPDEPVKQGKVSKNALRLNEKERKCKENDYKLLGDLNKEDREPWWLRRMLERFATRKKGDVLSYQDIMGHTQLREIKLPKNVLHLLQFLTYISTTEDETRKSMFILNGLKDRTDERFIATVKNINHIAVILSKAHAKTIKEFCSSWTEEFCKRHRQEYDELIWIKKPGKSLVVKRLDYVLKKCYYDQAMKFLNEFGFDPSYDTHCIEEHNTILKETMDLFKNCNFDKEAFFKKYMWNENQPAHWENTCIGTTNIFFNFLTWHLEKEMLTPRSEDDLVSIMDSMMYQVNEEQNTNLLKYDAYMVNRWNIFEIGKKLFGVDTNGENNVNICTHLQNHANSALETKKKRRKSSENNERKKKKKKKKSNLFVDDEAKVVGDDMEFICLEDESITTNNHDKSNEIDQQNNEQQEVQVNKKEPISEYTEVKNVHDLTMYTLKVTIEKSKKHITEQSVQENMDALLNDVNELDRINASAKIEEIEVPETLADWIGLKKV